MVFRLLSFFLICYLKEQHITWIFFCYLLWVCKYTGVHDQCVYRMYAHMCFSYFPAHLWLMKFSLSVYPPGQTAVNKNIVPKPTLVGQYLIFNLSLPHTDTLTKGHNCCGLSSAQQWPPEVLNRCCSTEAKHWKIRGYYTGGQSMVRSTVFSVIF